MKPGLVVLGILVVAWLGMWLTNVGVLVYSRDTGILKTRECRYFIGVSVLTRVTPLADRCQLVRQVGN